MSIKRSLRSLAALLVLLLMAPGVCALADSAVKAASKPVSRDEVTSLDQIKAPSPSQDFTFMRVLITTGSTSYVNLDLHCRYRINGSEEIYGDREGSGFKIKVSVSGGTVTVKARSSGDVIAEGDSVSLTRLDPYYEAGFATLTYCASSSTLDRQYLGDFTFTADGSSVRMINTVHMAYYLYGIVGYELNAYCQPEALKAQAMASKVFGMYFMDPSEPYDVQDGYTRALYQDYRGYKESRLLTMPYCLAVTGEAMSWNGMILYSSYGHTNGGETSLPSHSSPSGNTQYDGAYEVVLDDIEFDNYSECTEVVNAVYGETCDNSRFIDFVLCKARDELGISPTRLVSISSMTTYDPLPGTTRNMRRLLLTAAVEYASEERADEPEEIDFTLDCETSQMRSYELSDIDGSGDSYSSSKYVFTHNYRMYWGEDTDEGYRMYFTRYGLGTGLSQMGAEIRANPETFGWDYHQILAFYFPHFDIISIEETPVPQSPDFPVLTDLDAVAFAECSVDKARFQVGPSNNYGTIGTVALGEHVDILDLAASGWFHALWRGLEGYIEVGNVRITMFPSPANGVFTLMDGKTNVAANLRSEPRLNDGNIITKLPKNTLVTSWMNFDKWHYVTTSNGYAGFLSNVVTDYGDPYEYSGISCIIVSPIRPIASVRPIAPLPDPGFGKIGLE